MSECLRIAELVDRLGRIAHGLQFSAGLNPAQWEALRYIARANRFSRSPGAIARYMGTTRGTVSQTLIALEGKGYIARRRCPEDRRSVSIELTETGLALCEADPLCIVLRAAGALSCERQGLLADGLEDLVRAVQRARGLPEFGPCLNCTHFRPPPSDDEDCYCALNETTLPSEDTNKLCIEFSSTDGAGTALPAP